jgi:hypothetical protein
MEWLADVGSWITKNKDWLKPVAEVGFNAIGQSRNDSQNNAYLDYLRQQEDKNYQSSVDAINAYNAQGAAAAGARSRAAAANAAASRANQAAQQKAAKKAMKYEKNMYKKILEMYKPFADTATALLPEKTKTYRDSLGLQNQMLQFVNRPDQQALLTGSVPAWQTNIPLPDHLKGY